MTRPADLTRKALIEAATAVFAEAGYEGGSVRAITRRAKANQAAITYHFGGKEGLYREVLRTTIAAFEEFSLLDAEAVRTMDRDEALRRYVRQQLVPLLRRDQLSRFLRIANWEITQRSEVFQDFVAKEPIPLMRVTEALVRRFLPADPSPEAVAVTTIWLVNQGFIFVRNSEHLARPPLNLAVDAAFVERLAERLTTLLGSGLSGAAGQADRPGS